MRRGIVVVLASLLVPLLGSPVFACGGLIGPNGAVNLGRTTTLAAYVDGVEHYITAFEFAGGGGEFGSIVPLPDVPSDVQRGGDWTLQRLVRETRPVLRTQAGRAASSDSAEEAEVVHQTRIDALDITILRGGGQAVGEWAREHGFLLPPDAPEVLDFYASRSPIFMAAVFDGEEAARRGQQIGDGTPIHLTIPTDNPWVPLRILTLGRERTEVVEADVYLLTERKPVLLPVRAEGLSLERREPASAALLADLRSDRGMEWLPAEGMWLTYLRVSAPAAGLRFDLAVDASGRGQPSWAAAGLTPPATPEPTATPTAAPTDPPPQPDPTAVPVAAPVSVVEADTGSYRLALWALLALLAACGLAVEVRRR